MDRDVVTAAVREASAASRWMLDVPARVSAPAVLVDAASDRVALGAATLLTHSREVGGVVAVTGWTRTRAAAALGAELAETPDKPVDVAVTNTLLTAWGEEFDAFAAELAVELEGGDVAVSRAKLTHAFGLWLVARDPSPTQMLAALRAIVAAVRDQHAVAAAA